MAGDGGHYDGFGTRHDVNYHLRTIAHSTILVHDPAETWPRIRAGNVTGNDGGQHHAWPHHNGAVSDAADWNRNRRLYDIAGITAFEDRGAYVYVAGDCTRSYSPRKLRRFVRQIVFVRPGTFVVFDMVTAVRSGFRKIWLLQAMKTPERKGRRLVVTNGKGRLFIQTMLPQDAQVRLASGDDLYRYGGQSYPPKRDTGPAPECRVEVSPKRPATTDWFLHVLTATDSAAAEPPVAASRSTTREITVTIGAVKVSFRRDQPGGYITVRGRRMALAGKVVDPSAGGGR